MGVFNRLGYNFDSTKFGSGDSFTTGQAYLLNSVSPLKTWQADDLINTAATGYFQNPHSANLVILTTLANAFLPLSNTSNVTFTFASSSANSLYLAATNVLIELPSFTDHTNRISGVTSTTNGNLLPDYQIAMSVGRQVLSITNQIDGVQNNAPLLGNFTSLAIGGDIANTIILLTNDLATLNASMTLVGGNLVSSITSSSMNTIVSDVQSAYTLLNGRRTSDVNFYLNSLSLVNDYNKVSQFTRVGVNSNYLINTLNIGTDKLKTNLQSNTVIPTVVNSGTYSTIPNAYTTSTAGYSNENLVDTYARNIAQAAFDAANSVVVSTNSDNLARNRAQSAFIQANTATNNTTYLQGALNTSNVNIAYTLGVDLGQNTFITGVQGYSQSAYNQANVTAGALNTTNTNIVYIQAGLNSANANIVLLQSGLNTANANTAYLQSGLNTANANTVYIQAGLNSANANIVLLQSGLNTANANTAYLQSGLNTANANTVYIQAGLNSANANIINLQATSNTLLTNTGSLIITNGGSQIYIANTSSSALNVAGGIIGNTILAGGINLLNYTQASYTQANTANTRAYLTISPSVTSGSGSGNQFCPVGVNTSTATQYNFTVTGTTTFYEPNFTGAQSDGAKFILRIFATSVYTISWSTTFKQTGVVLPTATVANKYIYVACIYNSAGNGWDVVAVNSQ